MYRLEKIHLIIVLIASSFCTALGMEKRPLAPKTRSAQQRSKVQKRSLSEADQKLLEAVMVGNLEAIQEALDARAHVNAVDARGRTALFIALERGDLPAAHMLLEQGANPNVEVVQQDGISRSCLRFLVQSDYVNIELVMLLLAYGASPNDVINYTRKYSILHESIRAHDAFLARVLLISGADSNNTDKETGLQLIHSCAQRGDCAILRDLVFHGADINAENPLTHLRPLHYAIQHWFHLGRPDDKPEAILWLIYHGALLDDSMLEPHLQAILRRVINDYFPHRLLQNIILDRYGEAEKDLKVLSSTCWWEEEKIVRKALLLATARGHQNIIDYILKEYSHSISDEIIQEALHISVLHYRYSATLGFIELYRTRIKGKEYKKMIRSMLLIAATLGHKELIAYFACQLGEALNFEMVLHVLYRAAMSNNMEILDMLLEIAYKRNFNMHVALNIILTGAALALREDTLKYALEYAKKLNLTLHIKRIILLLDSLRARQNEGQYERMCILLQEYQSNLTQEIIPARTSTQERLPQPSFTLPRAWFNGGL